VFQHPQAAASLFFNQIIAKLTLICKPFPGNCQNTSLPAASPSKSRPVAALFPSSRHQIGECARPGGTISASVKTTENFKEIL
jgi:hypothetical protein